MAKKTAGTYYGTLVDAGVDTLKNAKKTPFLYLTFRVTHFYDGVGWADVDEAFDRDIKFFLSDAAWPYAEKDLEQFGFNGAFDNPKFKDEFYRGTELVCTVSNNDSDGKSYENWELPGTNRSGSRERIAPAKDVIHKLNARWKTNNGAKQTPATNRPPAPPISDSQPNSGPETGDDDLPF